MAKKSKQPNSTSVPFLEIELPSSEETLRQMISGIDGTIHHFKAVFDEGFRAGASFAIDNLTKLTEDCVEIGSDLPSGMRLALRAIHGSDWKKTFRSLQRVIRGWQPRESRSYERPTPTIGGTAATVAAWKEEEENYHRLPEVVKERESRTHIDNAFDAVIETLKSITARIELRIIGRQTPRTRKKKRNSAVEVDTILSKHFLGQSCVIDFLRKGTENGEKAAYKLAKKLFSMNAVARKLSLSKGSINKSIVYRSLQKQLRMNEKSDQFQKIGYEIALERVAIDDQLPPEVLVLINRIEKCYNDGKMFPDEANVLANLIHNQKVSLDKAEDMIALAELEQPSGRDHT